MALRISLECGNTTIAKPHPTPEGHTHDWEVFVKGLHNAEISHYVEKVVFHLHETFVKPKRTLKSPPYILKESGYAGFDIPIHVYLKTNKNEPKKHFEIMYKLDLYPPVSPLTIHNEIINNPSDDLRKKLLKGGAVPISNCEAPEKPEVKTLPMMGKPKLSVNEVKKHRISEPKVHDQFQDLFGTPIKTTKIINETKKPSNEKSNSALSVKNSVASEKLDKSEKNAKMKHSPHKDAKKEKISEERKEKKDKDRQLKDKEKNKEKSKRPLSPSSSKAPYHSPSHKRPPSPVAIKKPSTPPPTLKEKRPLSPKPKEKDSKKISLEKDKEKEKLKEISKSSEDSKSERKKEKKKHKEDRDKEKKEKHKDKERERSKDKESSKSLDRKSEKFEKTDKDKIQDQKFLKDEKKSPKCSKESNDKPKEEKPVKVEKIEKTEKHKESKDREKQKHKHKKRDKKDKRDGSREREKKEKREKLKKSNEKLNESTVLKSNSNVSNDAAEIQDKDSSDSAQSGDEEPIAPSPIKRELSAAPVVTELPRAMSPPPPMDVKKEKSDRKRERSKTSRSEERENKKKKKKLEEEAIKKEKDRGNSISPLLEPVSSSQSPIERNSELSSAQKLKDESLNDQNNEKIHETDSEQVAPDSTNSTLIDTEEPLVFSDDYVSQLKDLQNKIMTMQDNQELQRVVQVIAETGQYEITNQTFDFDLCTLDRRTVQRLQRFFSAS